MHRPRHGGQQLVALVSAVVFFVSPLVAWGSGARATEFENRRLASFPSVSQGWGFFTGLGQWATDNLVFRQGAVQAESGISRGVFGEEVPRDQGRSGGGPLQSSGSPQPGSQPANGNSPWQTVYPQAVDGKDGWLYYGYDVAAKCEPAQSLDDTITQLNRLRQAVESSGRKFVLIIPPDKTTEVPQHLPGRYVGKDCHDRATAEFWRKITRTGAIDLRKDLTDLAASSGKPIYHELDSHWTDEGAMVMDKDFADAVRPGVSKSWSAVPDRTWTSRGDLPLLLGRQGEIRGTYYQLRPDGKTDKTQVVSPDFRSPIRVTSPPVTGMITDKVGLMGDSYTIPTSRYLAASFSDLTIVHYATADANPAVVANAMADRKVVALEAVERNLAGGFSGILHPGVVDLISKVLADHPMH